jgi:hypothetical protein
LPTVRILPRFEDPNGIVLKVNKLLLELFEGGLVIGLKIVSDGHNLPDVFRFVLVVVLKVEVQGVLIADLIVELKVVVVQLRLTSLLQPQLLLALFQGTVVQLALLFVEQHTECLLVNLHIASLLLVQ